MSSNPVPDELYSMQHYVIKFVSDLQQVGGFHRFPPPIKLTATILLKVALNTIHQAKPNAFIYFFFQIQGTSVHRSSKHKFNVFTSTYWICLPSLKLFDSWLGVLDTISCVCRWLMLVSCVSPSILEYLLEKQLNLRVSYLINEKCIKMFETYKVVLATVRKTNLCFFIDRWVFISQ